MLHRARQKDRKIDTFVWGRIYIFRILTHTRLWSREKIVSRKERQGTKVVRGWWFAYKEGKSKGKGKPDDNVEIALLKPLTPIDRTIWYSARWNSVKYLTYREWGWLVICTEQTTVRPGNLQRQCNIQPRFGLTWRPRHQSFQKPHQQCAASTLIDNSIIYTRVFEIVTNRETRM